MLNISTLARKLKLDNAIYKYRFLIIDRKIYILSLSIVETIREIYNEQFIGYSRETKTFNNVR